MKIDVIIPCGGSSSRMGQDKLLLPLGGGTVLQATVAAFSHPLVDKIVIPCPPQKREIYAALLADGQIPVLFCDGGATRTDSVAAALKLCASPYVSVHDGARPFVTRKIIDDGAKLCETTGSAIACTRPCDSVRIADGTTSHAIDRDSVRLVQTPQFFLTDALKRAYAAAARDEFCATDDAQIYQRYIGEPSLFDGDPRNVKLTYPQDAELLAPRGFRVGSGWDIHRLAEGRKLILGGMTFDFPKGLLGHSDADVLTHAVMDAVLGALGLRDIGCLFPDDDPAFEGADSMKLLAQVVQKMKERGYRLNNLSATVICEKPKLKDSIPTIARNYAAAFGCDEDRINIAATTSEKTGAVGEGNAIAALAYASLSSCC